MALIWSARAKRDLKDIGTYIAKDSRTAAVAMVKRIVATATSLNEYPAMGHPGRVPDTRELLVPGTPYIVVYRMSGRAVRIVAVMHTSREWPDWKWITDALPMNLMDRSLLDKDGLGKTLGIEVVELTPERVVATMPVTPRHHQPWGSLHGGASVALAETVASTGGTLNCPRGMAAFGMEINANHLRPKRDGLLTAVGTPLHRGRTSQVWDIKIYDEEHILICAARCTLAVVAVE